ncbi:carbohydrate esterase family 5 protein [Periconia macrospinosa]|uniref:Cutinase n=1 Tax=Periconia macrospinosa TaxID=97972 RepID=A0A2V1DM13_9PLEO|nr:carbohydrate esterase family 5 protein [Periconia macrospinosa]
MLAAATLAFLSLLSGSLAAPATKVEERQGNCHSVHIFLARGTSEPYPGRQSAVVSAICNGITNCGYEDVNYPASTNPSYCSSVSAGIASGTSQITAYANRCPNAKLVLSGYSQGAQLFGDILGGGGGNSGLGCSSAVNAGLNPSTSPGNKIRAALFFGDPRHAASQVYNTGTGSNGNGINPRTGTQLASLNRFSNVLRSWCLSGDNVCARGTDPNAHTSYFNIFSTEAGSWVKTKL